MEELSGIKRSRLVRGGFRHWPPIGARPWQHFVKTTTVLCCAVLQVSNVRNLPGARAAGFENELSGQKYRSSLQGGMDEDPGKRGNRQRVHE